jgi:hypothetical protein
MSKYEKSHELVFPGAGNNGKAFYFKHSAFRFQLKKVLLSFKTGYI